MHTKNTHSTAKSRLIRESFSFVALCLDCQENCQIQLQSIRPLLAEWYWVAACKLSIRDNKRILLMFILDCSINIVQTFPFLI